MALIRTERLHAGKRSRRVVRVVKLDVPYGKAMRVVKPTRIVMCLAALLLAAGHLRATSLGTAYIRYSGLGAAGVGSAKFSPTGYPSYSTGSVYAGAYTFQTDMSRPRTGLGLTLSDTFGGFCVDMSQWARSQWELYDVVPLAEAPRTTLDGAQPMGETRAKLLENLWYLHYDSAWVAGGTYTTTQKREAEAFAAAVWEIAFEEDGNNLNVLTGALVASGIDNAGLANTWLAGLDADGEKASLYGVVHDTYQDYVILIPVLNTDDVIPEPHTMLGMLMGVAAVCRYLSRKQQRKQSRAASQ